MTNVLLTRRAWLKAGCAAASIGSLGCRSRGPRRVAAGNGKNGADGAGTSRDRVRGLLIGTFLGDALGGPIEFQDPGKVAALPDPPKRWREGEPLDDAALAEAGRRLRLRSYAELRPEPEPYAHWEPNAKPGTITDDSRHKLVLLWALERAERRGRWPFDVRAMARAYLDWPGQGLFERHPGYRKLDEEWLLEWRRPARWVLGERDLRQAWPPERMWNGLPTCCGQMTLPPLAAIHPGRPEAAYRAAYDLAFFDNGWGRDLNAGFVAALAEALACPDVPSVDPTAAAPASTWDRVMRALRETDPLRYREIPWCPRAVDRWLGVVRRSVDAGAGCPARVFAEWEVEFRETVKWEAQVPFVVAFGSLAMTRHDPLAALQLSLEWGHDTDSYAQMVGALVGAIHGSAVFPASMRGAVERRLRADFGVDLESYVDLLLRLARRARQRRVVGG